MDELEVEMRLVDAMLLRCCCCWLEDGEWVVGKELLPCLLPYRSKDRELDPWIAPIVKFPSGCPGDEDARVGLFVASSILPERFLETRPSPLDLLDNIAVNEFWSLDLSCFNRRVADGGVDVSPASMVNRLSTARIPGAKNHT